MSDNPRPRLSKQITIQEVDKNIQNTDNLDENSHQETKPQTDNQTINNPVQNSTLNSEFHLDDGQKPDNIQANQEQEQDFDIEELKINEFDNPVLIDGTRELQQILQLDVLKKIDNQKLKERYCNLITQKRVTKLVPFAFWFVFCAKFPGCINSQDPEAFINNLRQKLSKKYVKIFNDMPQPKDELVNYLIFILGYTVHHMFYKFFPKQRFYFDLRFILDCYHIIIFETNGLYVSDFYIRLNIDRIFNNKFLNYANKNKPKKNLSRKIEKKQVLHSVDMQDYFKEVSVSHTNEDFQQVLQKKFIQKVKQNINTQEEIQYKEILRERLESKTSKSMNKNMNQQYNYLQKGEQKPYFGNLRLNCNQISPTVFKVMAYPSQQLPFKRKKMIRHCFENVSEQRDTLMAQLKKFNSNTETNTESSKPQNQQKSMMDRFNLRAPGKEYYVMHQNDHYKQLFKEKQDSKANMYDNINKMFKGMLDLNYIFKHYSDNMDQLPSSKDILNKKLDQQAEQQHKDALKQAETNQIKLSMMQSEMGMKQFSLPNLKIQTGIIEQQPELLQSLTIQQNQSIYFNQTPTITKLDQKKLQIKENQDFYNEQRQLHSKIYDRQTHLNVYNEYDEEDLKKNEMIYESKLNEYRDKYRNINKYQSHDQNIREFTEQIQSLQNKFSSSVSKMAKM